MLIPVAKTFSEKVTDEKVMDGQFFIIVYEIFSSLSFQLLNCFFFNRIEINIKSEFFMPKLNVSLVHKSQHILALLPTLKSNSQRMAQLKEKNLISTVLSFRGPTAGGESLPQVTGPGTHLREVREVRAFPR
jgi:hypothetical protein